MKKFLVSGALIVTVLVLVGAGCSQTPLETGDNVESSVYGEPSTSITAGETFSASAVETSSDVVALSSRQRGMVRIYVVSAATKLPVAGVPLVVEHSSENKITNAEGWVEFKAATGNVYVPKMNGFLASSVVSTANGDAAGEIVITLQPEKSK